MTSLFVSLICDNKVQKKKHTQYKNFVSWSIHEVWLRSTFSVGQIQIIWFKLKSSPRVRWRYVLWLWLVRIVVSSGSGNIIRELNVCVVGTSIVVVSSDVSRSERRLGGKGGWSSDWVDWVRGWCDCWIMLVTIYKATCGIERTLVIVCVVLVRINRTLVIVVYKATCVINRMLIVVGVDLMRVMGCIAVPTRFYISRLCCVISVSGWWLILVTPLI